MTNLFRPADENTRMPYGVSGTVHLKVHLQAAQLRRLDRKSVDHVVSGSWRQQPSRRSAETSGWASPVRVATAAATSARLACR